jgi:hypothetical protein
MWIAGQPVIEPPGPAGIARVYLPLPSGFQLISVPPLPAHASISAEPFAGQRQGLARKSWAAALILFQAAVALILLQEAVALTLFQQSIAPGQNIFLNCAVS